MGNQAMQQISNDQMLIVYLSSMIKSGIALHNLIDNKLDMNEKERQEELKDEEARKKKQEEKENKNKVKEGEDKKDGEKTDKSEEKKSSSSSKSSNKNSSASSAKKSNLSQLFYQEQMTSMNCRAMAELIEKSEPKSSKLCSF